MYWIIGMGEAPMLLEERPRMARILIADDQEMMRDSLAATLAREGHEIVAAGRWTGGGVAPQRAGAVRSAHHRSEDAEDDRHRIIAEAKRLRPDLPVVMMTAFATVTTAVEAMKLGAYDYIQKPFDGDEIKLLVDRTLEHNRLVRENQVLRSMAETNIAAAADR
jgi:two-component system response regulator AtoC